MILNCILLFLFFISQFVRAFPFRLARLQDSETGAGVCLLWFVERVGGRVCNVFLYLEIYPLRVARTTNIIDLQRSAFVCVTLSNSEFQRVCALV